MRPTITPATRVVVSPDQVSCDLAGEAAILNLKSSIYYGLDPVGARIWSLMRTPTTVRVLQERVLEEYDVDPARCERELVTLLATLADEGLIEVSG